jgi:SPP1 gp7 family putative phage head morphogenesis protein
MCQSNSYIFDITNQDHEVFIDEEIETYLYGVFTGLITKQNLSKEYHSRIARRFTDALEQGFRGGVFTRGVPEDLLVFRRLFHNIYVFSAAKQYQQVRMMSRIITALNENAVFADFAIKAREVFTDFNMNYLRTEFNTAIAQAQSARDWIEYDKQKDQFPMLVYKTQNDEKVRPEHEEIHNIARPVNDAFWNTFFPPNGWNCRCFVVQSDSVKTSHVEGLNLKTEDYPELFRMNPGKDGYIFHPKRHPYFKVAKGDAKLRDNNFNLPAPERP